MVVADSYEAAREAAYKVDIAYEPAKPSATCGSEGVRVEDATEAAEKMRKELPHTGDAEAALATADAVIDAEYATPTQHHNPMELFTTTCVWEGDKLTIHEGSQFVYGLKNGVAQRLDEGYERGVHDADATAILAQILRLEKNAGVLRYSSQARARGWLFWQAISVDQRNLIERQAASRRAPRASPGAARRRPRRAAVRTGAV